MPDPTWAQNAQEAAVLSGIAPNKGNNVYEPRARAAARKYGIPEEIFVRLIAQESGWNPNAVNSQSGAAGLGQFMPETAKELGIDPMNPDQALDGAARYLKQQIDYYGGDVQKGLAAYNYGAGNVDRAIQQGGANWQELLPNETKKYIAAIQGKPLTLSGTNGANANKRTATSSGYVQPTLEDFKVYGTDDGGNQVWTGDYDVQAFNRAMKEFEDSAGASDDFASYLDAVIKAQSADIELGNSNVNKAKLEFDRQMRAHEAGAAQFNELLGYALPAGTEYAPFREPGGIVEKQLGMSPRRAPTATIDPFAEAWKIVENTPDLTKINTSPTGASLAAAMPQARALASSGGTSTQPTTPPPTGTAITPPGAGGGQAQQYTAEFLEAQRRANLEGQWGGL